MPQHLKIKPTDHDFSNCKLCGAPDGIPTYRLATNTIYVCSDCDFHYLDRFDPKADNTPVTLTDQQRRYIEDRLASNAQILTARMQLVREFVDLTGLRCLDVGTGVGQFVQMISASGAAGVGIEPSGLRLAFARQRFDLELHPEPIEEPFWQEQNSSFDLITLWDVLEHVNDPVATLKAAFDLLKPGGYLFIETDNRDVTSYRLSCLTYRLTRGGASLFLPNFYRAAPFGHKQIFRPTQLYQLSVRCGFELIAATPVDQEFPDANKTGYQPRGQIVLVARKPS